MDKTVLDVRTITEYNDSLELETLHPLVAVVDLSKAKPMKHAKRMFSFYTVFLKDEKIAIYCMVGVRMIIRRVQLYALLPVR